MGAEYNMRIPRAWTPPNSREASPEMDVEMAVDGEDKRIDTGAGAGKTIQQVC